MSANSPAALFSPYLRLPPNPAAHRPVGIAHVTRRRDNGHLETLGWRAVCVCGAHGPTVAGAGFADHLLRRDHCDEANQGAINDVAFTKRRSA